MSRTLALDQQTGKAVAVKMEPVSARYPQIQYEAKVIKLLQGYDGFPTFYS